ncbi:unnamed protein product, partial [Oppiella nova]
KVDKICDVCGDIALARNFGAIACESCKAFFRRTANKNIELECPSDGDCDIDVQSRALCQKCRLNKCLAIGMKKEFIRSDEENKLRKQLIRENKRKRKQLYERYKRMVSSTTDWPPNEQTLYDRNHEIYCQEIDNLIDSTLDISDDALNHEIMEIETYVTNGFNNILIQSLRQKSYQHPITP